ncbi:MAG: tRNA (guanosine(37)-N1)-methyltransferase TrmD [Saccharofermentans sp.]|nr:tRNA (guanosine(37)-N1)-methyltransferase TrmD [Mageeibacillus sp.]MCI1264883.1 tRNA (guanosine(37)-N1)-methyltransferase TrmD [Saccharofermentans sp.]MCI1275706.1 tRNA (guanosine(37)-N1)-methyltransferase TrmD [Saccharofermentans sp.]MCI1769964.1 tRNA (guanosine(37)-N1)-methyltransferase TrmD [Mageeibacillus sp.]MCI2044769.1 tRNA (guanosine(37)-N1)-methyltransferase TrmD [Mageeibacillus sp.]
MSNMNFHVITLFPDQITGYLNTSITGRAIKNGAISLDCVNIRDYCENSYGKIDDTMYGGGTGLLVYCQPVYDAFRAAAARCDAGPHTIYMSPKGRVFDEKIAHELAGYKDLVILCGHYEGIDERVINEICDEEISIGDYVLTGGETAAIVIIDAVSRLVPGVLPNEEAYTNESHTDNLLEAPQYTKPPVWHDNEVPQVLKNGNKAVIDDYNHTAALVQTLEKRPDMLDSRTINEDEWQKILAFKKSLC